MDLPVTFACGHQATVSSEAPPVCPICRETRVQAVTAPAPVFRGACTGPLVVKG